MPPAVKFTLNDFMLKMIKNLSRKELEALRDRLALDDKAREEIDKAIANAKK